jgi:hypothetical protein
MCARSSALARMKARVCALQSKSLATIPCENHIDQFAFTGDCQGSCTSALLSFLSLSGTWRNSPLPPRPLKVQLALSGPRGRAPLFHHLFRLSLLRFSPLPAAKGPLQATSTSRAPRTLSSASLRSPPLSNPPERALPWACAIILPPWQLLSDVFRIFNDLSVTK